MTGRLTPTADQIATAIVVACMETGEDPIQVAAPECKPASHARHYALQALAQIFPLEDRLFLATVCGCAGKPKYYWSGSVTHTGRIVGGPRAGKRRARWWSEESFDRVVAAIEAVAPLDIPEFIARKNSIVADDDDLEMPMDVRSVFASAERMQAQLRGRLAVPVRGQAKQKEEGQEEG